MDGLVFCIVLAKKKIVEKSIYDLICWRVLIHCLTREQTKFKAYW
jgi:hypothetical protein